MRVNICVIGDGASLANDELAAVVEENIFVDDAVVLDREVVAERNFNSVKELHILAKRLEHVFGDHVAHAISQPVIEA